MRNDLSLTDFGAIGDGYIDDTYAVQACMDYAAYWGYPVYIPDGTFRLTNQINVTGGLSINGASMNRSRLRWDNGSQSGIKITLGSSGGLRDTFECQNFSLLTGNPGLGVGLSIKDCTPADRFTPSVKLNNIQVRGAVNPVQDGWDIGIFMDSCQGAFLDSVNVWGKINSTSHWASSYGIYYGNSSGNQPHPSECHIINSTVKEVNCGVHADDMEGLIVHGNQIVGVSVGVNASGLLRYPHVSVQQNHINAVSSCVTIDKMSESIVKGNLFYNQNNIYSAVGVYIIGGSESFVISGNIFDNLSNIYSQNSILVSSGIKGIISSNIFRRTDAINGTDGCGIWLTSGSNSVFVADDNIFGALSDVNTPIINQGYMNRVPNVPFRCY